MGLISGFIVFIEAITGCLWVFQEEIRSVTNPTPSVVVQDAPTIGPSRAREIGQAIFPNQSIHGILYDQEPGAAAHVIFYDFEPEFYAAVYLNPYTGEVIATEDYLDSFFAFVLRGHLYLWLPPIIGVPLVWLGTILFLLIIISGLILWWPKNKAARKQRVWFRWKSTTRWRRKNFDLHAIFGFYAGILAFIIAYSGLVMTLGFVRDATYFALGGEKSAAFVIPENESSGPLENAHTTPAVDRLLVHLENTYPTAEQFEIHFPPVDSQAIYVEITYQRGVFFNGDYRFYDANTLAEIDPNSVYSTVASASTSDMVMRMNYDIHVGAIGGMPTKILAFLISFIIATLPVTGTLLWLGRIRKKKKAAKPPVGTPVPV